MLNFLMLQITLVAIKSFLYLISFVIFPDAITSANPRVIEDSRARKLSNDLKRCTYYETCATYGLNVERVFQDGMNTSPNSNPVLWEGDIAHFPQPPMSHPEPFRLS